MKRLPLFLLAIALGGCGSDVSGPGMLLGCLYSEGEPLEPGGVLQVRGTDNQKVCLATTAATARYLYIPFFATPTPDEDEPEVALSLRVAGVGLSGGADGSASSAYSLVTEEPGRPVTVRIADGRPTAAPDLPAIDWQAHDRLRRRELRELGPKIRPGPRPGPGPRTTRSALASARPGTAADVPVVGEIVDYNTATSCSEEEEDVRTGRVMYVSDHAVVVADVENPAGLTSMDYQYFAVTFDTLVHPVETAHFGEPTDIDDNDRVILFFTRAVNENNDDPHASAIRIGFFWSGDLFPDEGTSRLEACPAGNNAEMFYVIAPDPDGLAGRKITLEKVRELAIPLIGHEFQHLINASRRLFVNEAPVFEEPWLNEGLSHIAEELLFYEVAGLTPRRNLTVADLRAEPGAVVAFNEFMAGNFSNFEVYLEQPSAASLMGVDRLATRGASWSFLRYAADRAGTGDAAFFGALVNSRDAGLDNLAGVIGPEAPLDWMSDWTVSVYGDDRVTGLAARFTQPSWNMPNIYEESRVGRYPLSTRPIGAEDDVLVDLLAGGALYGLFSVAAGSRGAIHVEADRGSPPASLRGSVLRIR